MKYFQVVLVAVWMISFILYALLWRYYAVTPGNSFDAHVGRTIRDSYGSVVYYMTAEQNWRLRTISNVTVGSFVMIWLSIIVEQQLKRRQSSRRPGEKIDKDNAAN